eukprot:758651-Hanusia_phi.AAC.2
MGPQSSSSMNRTGNRAKRSERFALRGSDAGGSNPPKAAYHIPSNKNCEAKAPALTGVGSQAREYFRVQAHGTPGVSQPHGFSSLCSQYDVAANVRDVREQMERLRQNGCREEAKRLRAGHERSMLSKM